MYAYTRRDTYFTRILVGFSCFFFFFIAFLRSGFLKTVRRERHFCPCSPPRDVAVVTRVDIICVLRNTTQRLVKPVRLSPGRDGFFFFYFASIKMYRWILSLLRVSTTCVLEVRVIFSRIAA